MMPIVTGESRSKPTIDYKQMYRNLKRKLKLLIYENECYRQELSKTQSQLLQVAQDKSFLLDRLSSYEDLNSNSSDSDATQSSDSDIEQPEISGKRKKLESDTTIKKKTVSPSFSTSFYQYSSKNGSDSSNLLTNTPLSFSVKQEQSNFSNNDHQSLTPTFVSRGGVLTSEEIERRFESRPAKSSLLMPEKTPLTVPVELFSNESSVLPDYELKHIE